jgi:hypothetical protein
LSRCLNEKRGLKCVIETLSYATKNMYAAKQYHQDDYDSGVLMLKLGGWALCHAYSKFWGGPCMNSTIKTISDMPHYLTYSSEIDREMMEKNYNNFVFRRISASNHLTRKCLYVMMIDDIKGEKRFRVDARDGCLRGICYHAHKENISLYIKSEEDCYTIKQALDDKRIHPATEITNVAITPIREHDYAPVIVATSAGCTVKDPLERSRKLLQSAIYIYVKDLQGQAKMGCLQLYSLTVPVFL